MSHDPYEVLGVGSTASPEDIQAAYRARAKALHPDAGGKKEDFQDLQAAYALLSNPDTRADFDRTGIWESREAYTAAESHLLGAYQHLLKAMLEEGVDIDWNDDLQKTLKVARVKAKTDLVKLEARLKQFRIHAEGTKVPEGHRHVLAQTQARVIAQLEKDIAEHQDAIQGMNAALELARVYEFPEKAHKGPVFHEFPLGRWS